ncbi:MAG TPA: 5'-deoxyadenosine deaminase [Blastocatellia bacterium]|jgi:5-methylthioadenosine/S-adenosylhomocysteine deaminase|nr:5'-deoxyadenosine deaminase [Blastocatellia bacterium]
MSESLIIKNATVVTLDDQNHVFEGGVLVEGGIITALGESLPARADETIDAGGRALMPGFVQTHVHLCQTLFRGAADDLALIDWLKKRVWPMEAAHTADSLYASARLGIAELIRGGTTCALTMETVHHTEQVFRAVEESGFRATVGKCMMDKGDDVPGELRETADDSINESLALFERWNGRAGGRIRSCFAPRFAVSCTRELLERVAALSREHGVMVHTHASENKDEIELVERETGRRNIEYLNDIGLAAPHVMLAHCVHLDEGEFEILRATGTHVAHCPSSNLKLGSGLARVAEMIERGISVSLGSDGAACNNRLDMFTEMRLAALVQKALRGPQALPGLKALRMATVDGARALGLGEEVGSLEVGKRADMVLVNLDNFHTTPRPDLVSTIVYAAEAGDVDTVIIDGRVVMRERKLTTLDEQSVIQQARDESARMQRVLKSEADHRSQG